MNGIARPALAVLVGLFAGVAAGQKKVDYRRDVEFAIDAIGKQCKALLQAKDIDWKKVSAPLAKEAKRVKTDAEHLLLLWRLLARLEDGHAAVQPLEAGKGVAVDWPDRSHGPGLFLCRIGDDVCIKNAWGPAQAAGLAAGATVVAIDGEPAGKWLDARREALADLVSFSTRQQADFFACHQGLADRPGTRLELTVRDGKQQKKRTVTYAKVSQVPAGPAYPPEGLESAGDVHYGKTASGFGYLHVRRCKEELPQLVDKALAAIGDAPGIIVDFRGNGGGGFDHEALFGRFLPAGVKWRVGSGYESAGAHPFGGPMVILVDGTVRSAGETAAGQFLEDGRAYGIGESATAGMSSQKTTIELPSGLFALYVSVSSNKQRFHGGKGIEGIGVIPHEVVPFAAADLAEGKDTLIARAEALLQAFPEQGFPGKVVRYDPREHGWSPPK